MLTSKFTETQIITILQQGDAGLAVKDLCRQAGISTATYYQWKSKYGGLEASELRRVKDLEAENAKLKRMYAEMALDNVALKDLIAKKTVGPGQKREAVRFLTEVHARPLSRSCGYVGLSRAALRCSTSSQAILSRTPTSSATTGPCVTLGLPAICSMTSNRSRTWTYNH